MSPPVKFLTDRMLGTLTRYLRFMGYDTRSANSLKEGNRTEDTLLLALAREEGRILLTRDRELARRGGDRAVLLDSADAIEQVRQLAALGLIRTRLSLTRCSLCNTVLRPATAAEVEGAPYAPRDRPDLEYFWCGRCRKLYWMGSHCDNLNRRLNAIEYGILEDTGVP
ncbi:MAG: DUF5615 family PIN-like protein [Methanomicrobiales archaeon]|nr:DUF5615 family PIN-like protein [Methanomicrobiales archaeon]MDI6877478.1 DUF5615 family PIN-like protein [Methanomicrobiales archaeon]